MKKQHKDMTEQDVENLVLKDLSERCCWYNKSQGNIYQKSGVPDYLVCLEGEFIGIETKAHNGHQLTIAQLFNGYKIVSHAEGKFIVAFGAYSKLEYLPKETFNLSDDAKNAQEAIELSEADYLKLETIWSKVNKTKKSVLFC